MTDHTEPRDPEPAHTVTGSAHKPLWPSLIAQWLVPAQMPVVAEIHAPK